MFWPTSVGLYFGISMHCVKGHHVRFLWLEVVVIESLTSMYDLVDFCSFFAAITKSKCHNLVGIVWVSSPPTLRCFRVTSAHLLSLIGTILFIGCMLALIAYLVVSGLHDFVTFFVQVYMVWVYFDVAFAVKDLVQRLVLVFGWRCKYVSFHFGKRVLWGLVMFV